MFYGYYSRRVSLSSVARRLVAFVIDFYIGAAACLAALTALVWYSPASLGAALPAAILFGFGLFVAYCVICWVSIGALPGQRMLGLRVVRRDTGNYLSITGALLRCLGGIASLAFAGIGCLWALWDKRKQTWHDKISGAIVVRVSPAD